MSFPKAKLSIAMLVCVGFVATGCASKAEESKDASPMTGEAPVKTGDAPVATGDKPATTEAAPSTGPSREISGRVNVHAYALDNPVVVAQTDDGQNYSAPCSPDGSFAFTLPSGLKYRLLLANSISSGSYTAISSIHWNIDGGATVWAHWDASVSARIELGVIEPIGFETGTCSWCASASGAGGFGSSYNFNSSSSWNYSSNLNSFSYGSNWNYNVGVNWHWGWQVGGAAWNGSYDSWYNSSWSSSVGGQLAGSVNSSVSVAVGGGFHASMCLDYQSEFESQISFGNARIASAYSAEVHYELNGGCQADAPEHAPNQSAPAGAACTLNADCNPNSFCAQSVCRDVSP